MARNGTAIVETSRSTPFFPKEHIVKWGSELGGRRGEPGCENGVGGEGAIVVKNGTQGTR
eukprot:scaffold316_cov352-Pavlova_lutheri.AAC.4